MKNERHFQGYSEYDSMIIHFESGLISQYREHKTMADELGRKIVKNGLMLKELYSGFIAANFSDEDTISHHRHPRKKHSHAQNDPRRYTRLQKAIWTNESGDSREITYSITTTGRKVDGESILIKNPIKPHNKIYLNLAQNIFELHEGSGYQILAIVGSEPHIAEHIPGKNRKIPDVLDSLRDEFGKITQMEKLEK